MTRVAIQGVKGANSEYGARCFFPEAEIVECVEYRDVFLAVEAGFADCMVIPIENTTAGTVYPYYDLLLEFALKKGFRANGERKLRIWHHLIALPGVTLADIKEVWSHTHALAQCRNIMKEDKANNKIKWMPRPYFDTAAAAELIKKKNWRSAAAIATKQIARDLEMGVLREKIQDREKNITRFLWVQKEWTQPEKSETAKTSIAFCIPNSPGSLYRIVRELSENMSANIVRIESQNMIGTETEWIRYRGELENEDGGLWDLIYYLDFTSKPEKVTEIIDHLSGLVMERDGHKALQILGTYSYQESELIDTTNGLCRP